MIWFLVVLNMRRVVLNLLFVLSLLSLASTGVAETDDTLSPESLNALRWQGAYQSQKLSLDKKLGGRLPEGFKAGLTSLGSQKKFRSDRPIMGVLLPGAGLDSVQPISLSNFKKGMLEVELAFRLKRPLNHSVADVASLKKLVAVVAPAIELPDIGFKAQGVPTVFDIVRANVAAHSFIVGTPVAIASIDVEAVTVELNLNDVPLFAAQSDSLIGGQWQMLLNLINERIEQGWIVYPDQWLLTGAIGPIQPLEAGRYNVFYSDLGELSLLLEP
ncbi:hypothetical protein [Zhongshania sp.]|uniref:hypothetical protein n=1 Tax=Zhongshania sp. TaxID=1971902 RepID=UPI0039E50145